MASGLDCYAVFEYHLAGHDIWLRLVETSPGNAEWRRDLSISHDHIGDMQNAQDWRPRPRRPHAPTSTQPWAPAPKRR
jgi:hypothetical protein